MNNTGMKFGGRQKGTPNKRTVITENLTLPNMVFVQNLLITVNQLVIVENSPLLWKTMSLIFDKLYLILPNGKG